MWQAVGCLSLLRSKPAAPEAHQRGAISCAFGDTRPTTTAPEACPAWHLHVPGPCTPSAVHLGRLASGKNAQWQRLAAAFKSRLMVRGTCSESSHLATWAGCPLWQPLPRGKGCQVICAANGGHWSCMATCTLRGLLPRHPCTEGRWRLSAAGKTPTSFRGGQHTCTRKPCAMMLKAVLQTALVSIKDTASTAAVTAWNNTSSPKVYQHMGIHTLCHSVLPRLRSRTRVTSSP